MSENELQAEVDRLTNLLHLRTEALNRVSLEADQLRHLLGSHADGHLCTCEMTDPGKPGIEPPEWEQDPWCLTHPDMSVIMAEVERLRATASRVEALVQEWASDGGILSPDSRFTRDVMVREARSALTDRASMQREHERRKDQLLAGEQPW